MTEQPDAAAIRAVLAHNPAYLDLMATIRALCDALDAARDGLRDDMAYRHWMDDAICAAEARIAAAANAVRDLQARVAELENNGPAGINLGRAINAELRIAAVLDELADCTWGCGNPGNEMLTPCSTCRVRALLLP